MKKLALVIGIVSIFATNAFAGSIVCKPNIYGGQTCHYSEFGW